SAPGWCRAEPAGLSGKLAQNRPGRTPSASRDACFGFRASARGLRFGGSGDVKQDRGGSLTRSRPADLRSPPAGAESRATAAVNPRRSLLMSGHEKTSGLQSYALAERYKLLRFLAARGAGDEAEDLLHELWQRLGTGPSQ